MAKSSSKRKSDSALVTGKSSKHRKIDEPESSHEDSEDQLFIEEKSVPKYVKKTAVKSRKSEPARLNRNDEYEEDEGRMESQQFLALVELESKKKKRAAKAGSQFMDRFKENIQSSNGTLRMRIANESAESTTKSSTFLNTFRNAYALSRPLPPPSSSNSPSGDRDEICFVTMFARSQSLINNALSLIETFTAANAKTESCQVAELLDNEWEKEGEAAASVLAVGCNIGLEKYQALLQGAEQPVVEENDQDFVSAIYGTQEQGSFEYGWGKVARKSEKAAKRFFKFQRAEV